MTQHGDAPPPNKDHPCYVATKSVQKDNHITKVILQVSNQLLQKPSACHYSLEIDTF